MNEELFTYALGSYVDNDIALTHKSMEVLKRMKHIESMKVDDC